MLRLCVSFQLSPQPSAAVSQAKWHTVRGIREGCAAQQVPTESALARSPRLAEPSAAEAEAVGGWRGRSLDGGEWARGSGVLSECLLLFLSLRKKHSLLSVSRLCLWVSVSLHFLAYFSGENPENLH